MNGFLWLMPHTNAGEEERFFPYFTRVEFRSKVIEGEPL